MTRALQSGLPEHWRAPKLGRIVTMASGDFISADEIEESGDHPVVGGNGVRGYSNSFNHDGRHVVVGRQGALCGNVSIADGRFWATEHAVVATPRSGFRDMPVGWLRYLLESMNLNQYSQASAQPGLAVSRILQLEIPLPPLAEQERIAALLDTETERIDKLIAEYRRQIELVEEEFAAMINAEVTGRDRLSRGVANWAYVPIRRVARVGTGHTPSRSQPDYWSGPRTIPWLTTGDVATLRSGKRTVLYQTAEMITETGLANSSAVVHPAGTVAMSRTASVGFTCIMGTDMATSQDWVTWTCGSLLNERFLLWAVRGEMQTILSRRKGSTHQTIYMDEVSELAIPMPPAAEQIQIADVLDAEVKRVSDLIAEISEQIDHLREYRDALVTVAVTRGVEACKAAA